MKRLLIIFVGAIGITCASIAATSSPRQANVTISLTDEETQAVQWALTVPVDRMIREVISDGAMPATPQEFVRRMFDIPMARLKERYDIHIAAQKTTQRITIEDRIKALTPAQCADLAATLGLQVSDLPCGS